MIMSLMQTCQISFMFGLKEGLKNSFPELFSGLLVPKEQELVADHQRKGGREKADKYFIDGMT